MSTSLACLTIFSFAFAFAGSKPPKPPPMATGENETVRVSATLYNDKEAIRQLLGSDLEGHYIVLAVRVEPKYGKEVVVGGDDFVLRTDKDGERSGPFAPSQIAGKGALVLHGAGSNPAGPMGESNGPVWGGMPGTVGMPSRLPGSGGAVGSATAGEAGTANATVQSGAKDKDNPLQQVLKAKALPEKKTSEPVAGLLYFPLEKQKSKDLELSYKTPEGKLMLRWK